MLTLNADRVIKLICVLVQRATGDPACLIAMSARANFRSSIAPVITLTKSAAHVVSNRTDHTLI